MNAPTGNKPEAAGEFDLISRFFQNCGPQRSDVILGIGDDAAVVSVPSDSNLAITTDTLVEGTHFPSGITPHALGYRALAVNLSDLAAMGAVPVWASLSLSMPAAAAEWVENFAQGFFSLAERHNVMLIGGDTVRGPLAVTVTVHGYVAANAFVRRDGAAPGDAVYVTGTLGDAHIGLGVADSSFAATDSSEEGRRFLLERFLYPTPRVCEGIQLAGLASAMIDVSDGLVADLGHVVEASGVGAEIDINRLPLSAALAASVSSEQALTAALAGGDDYELCFTLPPEYEENVSALATELDCPITRIGELVATPGTRWRDGDKDYQVPDIGFRHF
jgi:thiamine-monophosphate kinase